MKGQRERGASPFGGALLAQSDLVPRTDAPCDSPSMENYSEEGSPFSKRGHPLVPASRHVESPRVVLGRDPEVLVGQPPAEVNTITFSRAPSTRDAYRLKWNLFVDWYSPRRENGHCQDGRGPAGIFGRRFVPKIRTWICAQSSQHALQGSGGELASAAPGGGRPSQCSAMYRPRFAHLCGPHAELQDLKPALFSTLEDSGRGRLSPNKDLPTG